MTTKCEPVDLLACQWTGKIWATVPIGLLVTGTFGNVLNVVVLSRRRLRKSSTSVYLLCLSCGDLTFLWLGMGPRMLLQGYDTDIKIASRFLCKFISWAPVTAATYSIWILVLLTCERLFLTLWPVAARAWMSVKTARIIVVVFLLVIVTLTSHFLYAADIFDTVKRDENTNVTEIVPLCTYRPDVSLTFYKKIWPMIVLFVLNIFPMLLIVVGNVVIAVNILAQRRKMRKVNNAVINDGAKPEKVRSATKMLFLVSGTFIASVTPFTMGNVALALTKSSTPEEEARKQLIYTILRQLLYCNFTFNFVLYFVSGTLFKQEWKEIVKEVRGKFGKLVLNKSFATESSNTNTISKQTSSI